MSPDPGAAMAGAGRSFARRCRTALLAAAALMLAACNGTAVATLTSTPSTDNFLAYRVSLVSVNLQQSGGGSTLAILPSSSTVDLTTLAGFSEIIGAATVTKGHYTTAVVTLDYTSAEIVYDDGSANGLKLTAVDPAGKALGQVKVSVSLDPSETFGISSGGSAQLALDFNLGLSNSVDTSAKTVTVTPVIGASASAVDSKQVRIRGPLVGVSANGSTSSTVTANGTGAFTLRIAPFNGKSATGTLSVATTDATTLEVNGNVASGSTGLSALSGQPAGTYTVAYGMLTSANQTTTTSSNGVVTTSADNTLGTAAVPALTFTASQVLAGTSVQGGGRDRVTGVVSGRSGNLVALQDATLLANDGTETFLAGTTLVTLGSGTLVTSLGQSATEFATIQQISVGSSVEVFGIVTALSSDNAGVDASAGHVRIESATASGLVTAVASGVLDLDLKYLGGRAVAAFDFAGSGAAPTDYNVDTGDLDLSNATVGVPVTLGGVVNAFAVSPPNFIASSLLDPTTLQAHLLIEWDAGTASPFASYDSTAIRIDVHNAAIGTRHQIVIGAQTVDLVGLSTDPLVEPDATSAVLYSIAHAAGASVESFNTYQAFITQLQAELPKAKAQAFTAGGIYTLSTSILSATQITILLSD